MKFFPDKTKASFNETVGKWYKRAKTLTTIMWMVSGFVFGYLNHAVGFWMLLAASFGQSMLVAREHYIQGIWYIDRGSALMERLLFAGDRKFILERLKKDAAWRGDEPDPEITRQLDEIANNETEFKSKMDEIIGKLTESLVTKDEPKAN